MELRGIWDFILELMELYGNYLKIVSLYKILM